MASVSDQLFTAFDVETTGLYPGIDRIVEIGAVSFRGDEIVGRFQTLVDPGIPMPREAGSVNCITDEMLKGQPAVSDALPRFLCCAKDSYLVAHNAAFDAGFIAADAMRCGVEVPDTPILDTRALCMIAFPDCGKYSLQALRRFHHIASDCAHRALADAEACRELFLLCLRRFGEGGITETERIVKLSGAPLGLGTHRPPEIERIVALDRAMRAGQSMEICYTDAKGACTVRRITPLSFTMQGGLPAVDAFCHLRNENRVFRISAIQLSL